MDDKQSKYFFIHYPTEMSRRLTLIERVGIMDIYSKCDGNASETAKICVCVCVI